MTLPDDFHPTVTLDDVTILALGFGHAYRFDGQITRVERFVQLLEALDEKQRAQLGLTEKRFAALVMLDELRGLHATGEHEQAKRMIDRVLQDLQEAWGATPLGEAKLMRPIARDFGRLAEVALATFLRDPAEGLGRVRQLRALGDPVDMERRRAAFATIDPPGFEKIALPVPVVHPARWPAAAAKLGTSIEDARALLGERADDVAADLQARLGAELLVRAIPLIPEDERPTLYISRATWFAGVTTVEEPLSEAYAALQARIARYARLVELHAPPIILDAEIFVFQRLVDRIAEAARTPFDTSTLDGWGVLDGPIHTQLPHRGDDGDGDGAPASCAWLTADRIAVAIDGLMSLLSIAEGRVVETVRIGGVQLQTSDDRYILTTRYEMSWGELGRNGTGCYDTALRRFLDEIPAHLPAVAFGFEEGDGGFEDAYGAGNLIDDRRGGWRNFDGDEQVTALAFTRGNDAVLLYPHGVFATRTMIHEVSADTLAKLGPPVAAGPCAVTRLGGRFRFLLPSRHVCDIDRVLFDITLPVDAAAFSPDGSQLLVVSEGEACIVDIEQRTIVWRHMLA